MSIKKYHELIKAYDAQKINHTWLEMQDHTPIHRTLILIYPQKPDADIEERILRLISSTGNIETIKVDVITVGNDSLYYGYKKVPLKGWKKITEELVNQLKRKYVLTLEVNRPDDTHSDSSDTKNETS